MAQATGNFEVNLVPMTPEGIGGDPLMGRMSLDKQFHGDLEATSKGEMLAARTAIKGSAGYVAIERVTGTLHGKNGSFVLQHTGVMTKGAPQLSVIVVPDSGTEELTGLEGRMTIDIVAGQHSYTLNYSLTAAA